MAKKVFKIIKSKFFVVVMLLCAYLLTNVSGCMHENKPQLAEDSWNGYIQWAEELSQQGYYEAAVRAAEVALEKDPDNAESYTTLADIHMYYRGYKQAEEIYLTAIERLGESFELTSRLNNVRTVDIDGISVKNSTAASKKSEDSVKYDTTWKYNEQGSVVSVYFRTRDWTRSDMLTTYEYDDDNNLVRETVFGGYRLGMATDYTLYEYDNNVLATRKVTGFDGRMVQMDKLDANGNLINKTDYNYDGSHSIERYDENGVLVRREVYDMYSQELYHSIHQPADSGENAEDIIYYNADDTVKYTSYREYGSSVKNIIRDVYYNPDGSLAMYLVHKDNNNYYIYDADPFKNSNAEELEKFKFYEEAYTYVNGLLGL